MMAGAKNFLFLVLLTLLFTLHSPRGGPASLSTLFAAETLVEEMGNSTFHYLLYERYFREGKYLEGLTELERAVELDKSSVFLKEEILPVYFDMGDYDETIKTAQELLELDGGNFSAIYYTGSVYEIRDDLKKAFHFYEKAVRLRPEDADVNFSLGRLYMKNKKYQTAGGYFERAVKNDPQNPMIRLTLAAFYEGQKKWVKTIEQYRAIYRINPDSISPLLKIGQIYRKIDNLDEAEKVYKKALETEPDNFPALIALAGIYEKGGDWKKVRDVLMKFHLIKDDFPEIEMYLGLAFLNLGEKEKAEDFFKKAVNLDPENAAVYHSLARIYIEAEEWREAIKCLDKCVEVSGENSDGYFLKGVCLDSLKDRESASAEFEKALKLDPSNHRALNYMSYSWAEQGVELKKAEEYINRALRIEPGNAAYLDTAGWVQYKMGDYRKSLKFLRAAAKTFADPEIFEHLGDCLMKLEKKSEAKKAYLKAVETGARKESLEKKIEAAE
ncbi:MAG: tetratricopeptide repeat protein [bacterium]